MGNPPLPHPFRIGRVIGRHDERIRAIEGAPMNAQFDIKIVQDGIEVLEDTRFVFMIPQDLGQATLIDPVEAFVTAASANDLEVEINNYTQGFPMLSSNIIIDGGTFTTNESSDPPVVEDDNAAVAAGDLIEIIVTDEGDGTAEGLGVVLNFR